MTKIIKVTRTINYYQLDFGFHPDYTSSDGDNFKGLFRTIHRLAIDLSSIRYQKFGEKSIFVQNIKFDTEGKYLTGMLRCIRTDILPELMNTKTDVARGIEAKEEEGLLETTHFIIDFSNKKKIVLGVEFNMFGAKISDFVSYLKTIGIAKRILVDLGFIPIVNKNLSEFKRRIQKCSEFVVKVHKDNIPQIKSVDTGLATALAAAQKQFASDYAELILKFDYKDRPATEKANNIINTIISKFKKDPKKAYLFNTLHVKAEDSDKNYLLETFDLLADKIKSEIKVQKKEKYRTIISTDMFIQMKAELIKKRL